MIQSEYRVPKEQSKAFLDLALTFPFAKKQVGREGAYGIRFVFFHFLALESYTSFEEPALEPWRGMRFVFWKKLKEANAPWGWKKWPGIPIGRTFAVALVHPEFLQDWASNARRLALGQEKEGYTAKQVSLEEFGKAYHTSGYLDPFLRSGFLRVIRDHLRVHARDVSMLLFFTKKGESLGGAVFVDYPDISQSHYLISFLTPKGRSFSAGYTYIYWWYQRMLQKKLRWADFGIVWQKGDPPSWQGYSQFKKRFHPTLYSRATYWKWG